jgi:VPDSG-CTERM motif
MKIFRTLAAAALISGLFVGLPYAHALNSTYWANDFSHTGGVGGGGFDFNNGPVIGTWDNFADYGDLILTAHFDNGVTFDNTSFFNAGTHIQPWGTDGATATYGQTFIAPEDATKLNDFSFWVTDLGNGANFQYQAFVMTWTGNLVGGGAVDESGQSVIFATNLQTYTGNGNYQEITTTIGAGGLSLVAGQSYLFGLTTLGTDIVKPTGPGISTAPDGGASLLLLSLGLGAIAAARRRFGRA